MNYNGRELLSGVVVPVVTTMNTEREPDAQQMHSVLDELSAASITKIMLYGSNGEGPVLGEHQLGAFVRSVSLQWQKRAPGGALMVNISGSSTADSLRRADAVLQSGANVDALLLSAPMYFRHSRPDIRQHFGAFSSLGVPIVAYNSPAYTGTDLDENITRDLIAMEHVIGMKDSSQVADRIPKLVEVAAARESFGINQGDESAMVSALQAGAVGVTPGISNLAPRVCVDLFASMRVGDVARAQDLQEKVAALIGIHKIRPGVATMKASLEIRGICQRNVSLPFVDYSPEDLARLAEFLKPWDSDLAGSLS